VTQGAFQSAAKRWLLCLLAAGLCLPAFMLLGAIPGVCTQPQGLCFAISIILMFWVAPIAAVVFSLLLLWTIARRVRGLGLGPGWTAAVCIWFLSAVPTFAFGAIGLIGSTLGGRFDFLVHSLMAPTVAIVAFLLVFVAFLWRAEPDDIYPQESARLTAFTVAAVVAAHVTLLHAGSALSNLRLIPFLGLGILLRPVFELLSLVASFSTFGLPRNLVPLVYWFDFAVFSMALGYVVANNPSRGAPPRGHSVIERATSQSGAPSRATFGRRGS
jgi:hypothetical protein